MACTTNEQHPEGTVLKRVGPAVRMIANGEPAWYLDFRYTDTQGKRKRFRQKADVQSQTAAVSEGEARKAKALRCGNPAGPIDVDGVPVETAKGPKPWAERPLREGIDTFLNVWAPANVAFSTQKRYRYTVKTLILPRFGDTPIGKIDRAAISAWDGELASKGMTSPTRRSYMIVLRALLCRCAVEHGWLAESPRLPTLPASSNVLPDVLSPEQVEAILAASNGHARLAFLLTIEAGLRPAEVMELRWGDVQMQKRQRAGKTVEKMILRVRRGWVSGRVTTTKSGKERIVPVSDRLREALGQPGDREDLVTRNMYDRRWGEKRLYKAFKRALKNSGTVGMWRYYDLRHYFCTMLFRSGVNPRAIMSLMGHANLGTTLRYAHVVEDDLFVAVETKDAFTAGQRVETAPESGIGMVANKKPSDSAAA